MTVTASFVVRGACEQTERSLARDYIFVASLVKRSAANDFPLAEVVRCLEYPGVVAFNATLSYANGGIPEGETLLAYPSRTEGVGASVLLPEALCPIQGVENLALVYPFFSGECTVREGTGLTPRGYAGEVAEVVIPWYLAERHGIRVGDTVNRRYYSDVVGDDGYWYIPTVVVGIYETSAPDPETEDYPAYMPLAVTELDFGELQYDERVFNMSEHHKAVRADFVLEGREAFASFVAFAKERGVNFQNVNMVFNNSTYDVLASEIGNIRMIATIVWISVIVVGLGILIFFTVYLYHARDKERLLLGSLGMKRGAVRGTIALELIVLFVVFAVMGLGVGELAAEALCRTVDDTVLARASASDAVRDVTSASEFDITMPLEKNMRLRILGRDDGTEEPSLAWNRIVRLAEDELGVSRHRLFVYQTISELRKYAPPYVPTAEETMEIFTRERTAVDVIGVTDLSAFILHETSGVQNEQAIRLYVSEDFCYRDEGSLFLCRFNAGDTFFNDVSYTRFMPSMPCRSYRVVIAGTYEKNEFCSGNEVLVSMEDYHKLYSLISLTDPDYHFHRIGEVVSASH